MNTTQNHIPILNIKDDIVLLKDGGAVAVLKTTAVNFGLLSGQEQIAIISSFAQMLNSLSFAIQIVIRSKRLDISSYIHLLDNALKLQNNPLLAELMVLYRQFVESLIKENEVLDKIFYVAISVSPLELGIRAGGEEERLKKAKTILLPRRDQIIRQLARVGLKATQLESKQLLELFYDIYNPLGSRIEAGLVSDINLQTPVPIQPKPLEQQPSQVVTPQQNIQPESRPSKTHPFVVEELIDSI